ncbi:Magnesium-chelatase 38 kDa subunit [Slackia heliotrinireducens]|nr:AAA family ATPase [Slackia heliotrinireducens]VEH00729.1 Magnesium-chelatase 38 kDa subunit [Slackia heliotrinireducens]
MPASTQRNYPFSAIVGQEDMKLALSLISVQPAIGGVLIYGERGTAKTTAVRALPALLGGETRVIELPLNASEDRVVGTLQLGTLMKSGEREFVPGLMAEANGHILYVDEINLLEDSIVDLLLDAAATGVCRVEREGMSLRYPAKFVLIGTMNPEEGTLRPQLLDRFGLSVKVSGSLNKEERLTLIRRHTAFENDPEAFVREWQEQENLLAQRIQKAAKLYADVFVPDDIIEFATGLCVEFEVDGYRGDITMMRTARAAAALEGRTEVTEEDVLLAARFVLPHRLKKLPFEDMGMTDKMLEKAATALHKEPEPEQVAVAGPVALVVEADEPADDGGADVAKKG